MNLLIISDDINIESFAQLCKKSKLANKICIASSNNFENIPSFSYDSYEELINKAKAFQADVSVVFDKELVADGIVDIFGEFHINLIAANEKWMNLEKSKVIAKQLMNYYSINNPKLIKAPTEFPVVLKLDDSENKQKIFANSIEELIENRAKLVSEGSDEKVFIEEFMEGEEYDLISLWDKASMLYFPLIKDNNNAILTEVQIDRLNLLKTKLNFMFSDEKADFIGFITTHLLWAKNDWYVLEYKMCPDIQAISSIIENNDMDILYVLNSAIYQKLGENS